MIPPINFLQWIEENRDRLKPPVCNQVIYQSQDFIIMVVGGPNARHDYHVNQTEEFFYQIEGEMILKVIEQEQHRDIRIKQGEIFLLPANIPHSPQRLVNTVGLVIERKRLNSMKDGFQWYCEQCGNKLYEEFVHVSNIVTQLPPILSKFYQEYNVCKRCGHRMEAHANH